MDSRMTMYAAATKSAKEHARNGDLLAALRAAERVKNAADRAVTVAAAAAHDTGEFAEYRKAVAAARRATEYADAYAAFVVAET